MNALFAFKAMFNDPFLIQNWTGIHCFKDFPSQWYGIQCDINSAHVTGIVLEDMRLNGEIKSDAFADIPELIVINFKNNIISGNFMNFSSNHKLKDIDLSGNKFYGEISRSLLSLKFLESLQLQNNNLTGPVPEFNQSSLKVFNVSNNNLSGSIPKTQTLQLFRSYSYSNNPYLCGEDRNLVFIEDEQPAGFKLNDLLKAPAEGLGKGIFGNSYKALLEGRAPVVVKRLRDLKPLITEEFRKQLLVIADQKHPNLLPLLAYYFSNDEKLLVYKFAGNGNLFNRIHGGKSSKNRIPFRCRSRLLVARGVARALEYLHHKDKSRTQSAVIHGNLKSTNILLDDNEMVLVSDYGFSSLVAQPIAAQRMISYKSPEYQSSKKISRKSDVWSFGCLLLELLTGRISTHSAPQGINGADLCSWVLRAVREEWTAEIFDSEISVQRSAAHGMLKLLQVAIQCCNKSPEKRPEMAEVVSELEIIKVTESTEEEEDFWLDQSLTDESLSISTVASASERP
ncbi:probable inactive receptor kinase At2g26730 [Citrus sinensis]|uniref:probable inactive receptor kinase At2g26730 n=1 Tax=Citrus clementina TaxID=85681 RepID=UPI000CED3C0B|nr:probable inactive receptor kinase At2g26730 [Citrus x clementina]XP_052288626.1 probable inactive receptor kinase At2g26730 [Citrus sinensis]